MNIEKKKCDFCSKYLIYSSNIYGRYVFNVCKIFAGLFTQKLHIT